MFGGSARRGERRARRRCGGRRGRGRRCCTLGSLAGAAWRRRRLQLGDDRARIDRGPCRRGEIPGNAGDGHRNCHRLEFCEGKGCAEPGFRRQRQRARGLAARANGRDHLCAGRNRVELHGNRFRCRLECVHGERRATGQAQACRCQNYYSTHGYIRHVLRLAAIPRQP